MKVSRYYKILFASCYLAFHHPHSFQIVLVKDCKEFQGELFGICNLFRDLSDKLFTSEIVEFCEKEDGKEHDQCHRSGLDLTELGISFDRPQEEIAANCMEECQSTDPNDSSRKTRVDPVLEDLGKFCLRP